MLLGEKADLRRHLRSRRVLLTIRVDYDLRGGSVQVVQFKDYCS